MRNKLETSGDHSPILNDCNITMYNQMKYDSVMARKNEIYIPIIEELISIDQNIFKAKFSNRIDNKFIKEVISRQYKYRVEDALLNKLIKIDGFISEFNKIDIENISGHIIVEMFTKGFIELYGDINDGEVPIYYEGYIIDYDTVYPEEYENIELIAFNSELLKGIIQDADDYIEYENELYNRSLINMFEFALAARNKKYSPKRIPIIDWDGIPEYYIASQSDFNELYNTHSSIIAKRSFKQKINDLCKELANDVDRILKEIFIKYEKE
ncbi:hypothetical protein JNUCC31_23135 [Paenibacillus sp. JNUCC31]|uniref:hypothetical protein n=1 Tax=Paenibacillus sp. JNUCC-31 TaxID=2777983 RepID=UPI001785926C|nr:hypothetical protein [Paenibacillus sp. JNUCC-31]QOS77639.1 hypothetical protein JNUCC31_23135 [Paenibacillus sp. JNUCC-31]